MPQISDVEGVDLPARPTSKMTMDGPRNQSPSSALVLSSWIALKVFRPWRPASPDLLS